MRGTDGEYRAECPLRPMPARSGSSSARCCCVSASARPRRAASRAGRGLAARPVAARARRPRGRARARSPAALRSLPVAIPSSRTSWAWWRRRTDTTRRRRRTSGARSARRPATRTRTLNLGRLYQENAARDPGRRSARRWPRTRRCSPTTRRMRKSLYQSAVLLQKTGDFARSLERLSRLPEDERSRAQVLAAAPGRRSRRGAPRGGGPLDGRAARAARPHRGGRPGHPARALRPWPRRRRAVRLLERVRARGLASAEIGLARLAAPPTRPRGLSTPPATRSRRVGRAPPGRRSRSSWTWPASPRRRATSRARSATSPTRVSWTRRTRVSTSSSGWCASSSDLGVEAYNALKEAVRLDPGNAAVNYAMGAVSLHRRDPARGRALLPQVRAS